MSPHANHESSPINGSTQHENELLFADYSGISIAKILRICIAS